MKRTVKRSREYLNKWITLVVIEIAVATLWWSGATALLSTELNVAALRLMGHWPLRLGHTAFAVGDQAYRIVYACTPTTLWAGGILLLALAPHGAARFLATAARFVLFTALGMAAAGATSIHLHRCGAPWAIPHQAMLVAVYLAAFVWCLRRVQGHERVLGRTRKRTNRADSGVPRRRVACAAHSPQPAAVNQGDLCMPGRSRLMLSIPLSLIVAAGGCAASHAWVPGSFGAGAGTAAAARPEIELKYFTAKWCAPCKAFQRTTLADQRVRDWLEAHATFETIDIDASPSTAEAFGISGTVPTFVVLREGVEFDRRIGYLNADDFLAWLGAAMAGRDHIAQLRNELQQLADDGGDRSSTLHWELADELIRREVWAEATDHLRWLWLHHGPVDDRKAISSAFARLIAAYPDAAETVHTLRRNHEAASGLPKSDADDAPAWLYLTRALDDKEAMVRWYDIPGNGSEPRDHLAIVETRLFDALIARGRWRDAYDLYAMRLYPVTGARSAMRTYRMFGEAGRAQLLPRLRQQKSALYAACLAAGREAAAEQIATIVFRTLREPETRVAFVEMAVRAGQPRPVHQQWLARAASQGGETDELLSRLNHALEGR